MSPPLLDQGRIEEIILNAVRMINMAREPDNQLEVSSSAILYGTGSPLDSLGLVSLLMEIEEGLRDEGAEISLSDERAMSQKHSPFRNVPTLAKYIESLLSTQSP